VWVVVNEGFIVVGNHCLHALLLLHSTALGYCKPSDPHTPQRSKQTSNAPKIGMATSPIAFPRSSGAKCCFFEAAAKWVSI